MTEFGGETILVTGVTGFIGRHLLRRLYRTQAKRLVLLSRQPQGPPTERAVYISSSLEDLREETWRSTGLERIDRVLHFGGFAPKSATDADCVDAVYRDNLLGTRFLLESLVVPPKRFLLASSLDVYGIPPAGTLLDERSPTRPSSLFAASKLFCEALVWAYASRMKCDAVVLRFGHVFGPGEERYAKAIPTMIGRLRRGEAVEVHGDGSAERDYLYVDDAAEAAVRAASAPVCGGLLLNIVRGASSSLREVAEILLRLTDSSTPILYRPDLPAGSRLRFNNERMVESLGQWPLVSLEEGLRRELACAVASL